MAEIARLDAILGADISQFEVAFGKAEADIVSFSKLSQAASQLKPFSGATASALSAAKSIGQLEDVLAQLKIEQKEAFNPAELTAYNAAIKAVSTEIKSLSSQGNQSGIAGIGKSLTGAFSGLRQIAYILPGIGIAGIFNLAFEAISKATAGLNLFGTKTVEATEEQKAFQKTLDGLEESVAKDIFSLQRLSQIAADSSNPYNIRLNAIKKLKEEYPEYLKGLSNEAFLTGQAASAIQDINQALLAKLTLEAGEDKIVKLLKERLDIQLKLNDLQEKQLNTAQFAQSLKDATGNAKALGVQMQRDVQLSLPLNEQYRKSIDEIDKQVQALFNTLRGAINLSAPLDLITPKPEKVKALKDYNAELIKYLDATKKIFEHKFGGDEAIQSPVGSPIIGEAALRLSDIEAQAALEKMREVLKRAGVKVFSNQGILSGVDLLNDDEVLKNFEKLKKGLGDIVKITTTISDAFGQMFSELISGGTHAFKALEQAIVGLLSKLIATVIEAAILSAILNSITGGTSFLTGGASFGNILKQLLGGGLQFAHAEGGIFTQPTRIGNHLFGEAGPEALIPLDRLAGMMDGIGGVQRIELTGRISGNDIVLVQNKTNLRNTRNYGNNYNTTH